MIPHNEFGRLRLSAFVPAADIAELDGWEFQGHQWVGEALGFSEWLRLRDDPEVLRSLAIDLAEFPAEAAAAVLKKLQLPVRRGMTAAELDRLLGPRVSEQQFVAGRKVYDYLTPAPNRYRVSCTVEDARGLSYLVIMVPPIGDPE